VPVVGHVSSSEEWLEQVLVNLLLNAERALRHGQGRIVVQLRYLELARPYPSTCGTLSPGAYAVLRVQDSGPGFSSGTASRAFEPFYSEWGPPHLGVGLTTVFEMLRKSGGSVEIETPGAGASVAVYIPLGEASPDGAPSTRGHVPNTLPSRDWKDHSLRYGAKCAALCTALAMFATEVQRWIVTNGMWSHLTIGTPLLCTYAVVARSTASYTHRLSLLVGGVCAASLAFIANVGFMAPAGIAGLSLSIMFTWALGSPKISLGCLGFAIVGLLGVGILHSHELVTTPSQQTSLASAGNWYRVAVSLPSIAVIGSILVLKLVDTACSNVRQLATLQITLSNTEQRLFREIQVVSNIDQITARTSELESLSRMTGAVAHDINNSLQAVTSWASMLTVNDLQDPQDTREALVAIESAINHADVLLADLDFNRLDPHLEVALDLARETQRIERSLRVLLTTKHRLVINASGPAPVRTNPHAYQRALFNLVSNARDAMANPGTCTVHVQTQDNVVTVVVEDDGCGMDEKTLQRLFDPYFTTKSSTGHGLGLFSVASLTENTKGSIRTWSVPGKGTRITLTLPRAT
jgi:signal transduction histidine kinase